MGFIGSSESPERHPRPTGGVRTSIPEGSIAVVGYPIDTLDGDGNLGLPPVVVTDVSRASEAM
jgi:hypothetical protein